MVLATSVVVTSFCWLAMQMTASGRAEYVDYGAMTAYAGWAAFFQICIFLVPLTLAIEPDGVHLRWLYFMLSALLALSWTALLDGPTQAISYVLAVLIGIICATLWTGMIIVMKPWKQIDD